MKKTKVFGFAAAMILGAAGLVACGGGETPSSESASHKHAYEEVAEKRVEATCTAEGKKVEKCTVCGEEKESKISKKAHTWKDDEAKSKAATCTEAGVKAQVCEVCKEEKTTDIAATGHKWVDKADQAGAKAATCLEAGEKLQECEVCKVAHTEAVEALGHSWGEPVMSKEATCTTAGQGEKECDRCKTKEAVTVEALGHDIQLVGDEREPEEGKALVRVYTCARECGTTYLGFKANEPSTASLPHLVIQEDGGARFWGRPIGNAVALDDEGSASSSDHEPVFDENETGDFFEYIFDLTADQAAALEECYLYCDAKPAAYLNGQDFWAADQSAEEWTPGMYIDGEQKGERITDYRYVLYVDDVRKDFDPTMKSPVTGGAGRETRGEFILPYKFSLHAGTNKIRLVMSGGYRSLFYNFTFRAIEEQPEPEPEGDAIVFQMANATGTSGTAVKHGKKSNYPADTNPTDGSDSSWLLTGVEAGNYKLVMNCSMTSSSHSGRYWYNMATAGNENNTSSPDTTSEDPFRYVFHIDSTKVDIANTKTYGENGMEQYSSSATAGTDVEMAAVTIPAGGATTLRVTRCNIGYSVYIYSLKLIKA
ncbi:MAG: hypothetical protein HUJ60_05145 [Bacilli bacterium]|nr:hypothetical protein [Bacilli bacterium]